MSSYIFSISYLPSLSYFSLLLQADEVVIEQHEHYIKQTYRNRTEIYGANGILPLVIPVDHHNLFSIPIKEVKIANDQPWQKIHWRSIESAYRNSPYFEYYEDKLKTLFETKPPYLFEWNQHLLLTVLDMIGVKKNISFTESYQKQHDGIIDMRNEFIPEKRTLQNKVSEALYKQVFSERHGFIPNLSIIDLLFNEGPKTLSLLQLNADDTDYTGQH